MGMTKAQKSGLKDLISDKLQKATAVVIAEYRGLTVPEVLLGGNHAEIAAWRKQESLQKTRQRRADLLDEEHKTDPRG